MEGGVAVSLLAFLEESEEIACGPRNDVGGYQEAEGAQPLRTVGER